MEGRVSVSDKNTLGGKLIPLQFDVPSTPCGEAHQRGGKRSLRI